MPSHLYCSLSKACCCALPNFYDLICLKPILLVQLVAGTYPVSDFLFMLAYRFERKLYRIVVKNAQG